MLAHWHDWTKIESKTGIVTTDVKGIVEWGGVVESAWRVETERVSICSR